MAALEGRLGFKVDVRRALIAFMLEYAAHLLNRLEVGKDGKTAYERAKGKKAKVLGLEFGEKLMYKVKAGTKMEKFRPRWGFGIFVGIRRRSGEVKVVTKDGLVVVRSVRRLPVEERWGRDCVDRVRFVPWHRYRGDDRADGEVPDWQEAGR